MTLQEGNLPLIPVSSERLQMGLLNTFQGTLKPKAQQVAAQYQRSLESRLSGMYDAHCQRLALETFRVSATHHAFSHQGMASMNSKALVPPWGILNDYRSVCSQQMASDVHEYSKVDKLDLVSACSTECIKELGIVQLDIAHGSERFSVEWASDGGNSGARAWSGRKPARKRRSAEISGVTEEGDAENPSDNIGIARAERSAKHGRRGNLIASMI